MPRVQQPPIQQDPYPTTLPVDIQQPESVPRPTEYDVGATWIDDGTQEGGNTYMESILDSHDQFKDVITS